MISVEEADALLAQAQRKGPAKLSPLHEARGRYLRQDLKADRDYPPFDRVAMDGYALSYAQWAKGQKRFRIQSMQTAGQKPSALKNSGDCIEIMTGAKLPEGCDLVVRYEDTKREGDVAVIIADLKAEPFGNVHRRADDCQYGDAFSARLMNPAVAAVAASFGIGRVHVAAAPRVAIIGTGDELVSIDTQPTDYQIRASNTHALRMAMDMRGFEVVACENLADDRSKVHTSLQAILERTDFVLMTGAVSAGAADFVPSVLTDLGVRKIFHKIAQKPGKPIWFGQSDQGATVFGLPGNPVSTIVCAYRYAIPMMERWQTDTARAEPYVELRGIPPGNRKMTLFLPVALRYGRDAKVYADLVKNQGSGDFVSLTGSDGFIEVPGEMEKTFDPEAKCFRFYSW